MFKNYLKIAFRNLWKNKSYAVINIIGLSVGLTVCLLVFLFIRYEISFDRFHQNKDRIYRVVTTWKYSDRMEYSQGTPLPLSAALQEDFPGIEKVAPVLRSGSQVTIPEADGRSKEKFDESGNIFVVSPEFYQIFSFPWLEGDPATALKEPNTAAITQSLAKKYFGDWRKAVGKSMLIDNTQWVKITGIIKDIPKNTDLPVKIAVSYVTFAQNLYPVWAFINTESHCYIMLKKNASLAGLQSRLPAFVKKYYPDDNIKTGLWGFAFQPLKDIHFNTRYGAYGHQINPKELVALGITGLFILLIACINFINMSTAQSAKRAKEVGIRKVLGSRRKKLALQFLGETLLITLTALLLACILTELAMPWMRNFFDQPIAFNLIQDPVIIIFLAAIVITTGLLAGIYPALVMSGFDPVVALKGKVQSSGSHGLRKTLVVVQFTISLIVLIGMWIMLQQMNFFRNKPMGFDRSAISLISLPDDSASVTRYETFKNKLSQLPGVEDASLCYDAPSSRHMISLYFSYNNGEREPFDLFMKYADTGYFHTFGLQLIAGRIFHASGTMREAVVNETLLKKLQVTDPQQALGKYLAVSGHKAIIVGVVKDFVNFSLAENVSPIAITTDKSSYGNVALKLRPSNMGNTLSSVKTVFNQLFPDFIYQSHFLDDQIAKYYITEDRMATLFKAFAVVVFLISFTGLLSLLSFITAQRTKEIAVRKILGASLKDILKLLGKNFVVLVIIANVIAFPVAYILAQKWLNGFAYRIDMPVMPFVWAGVLSVILTSIIVSLQVMRAARTNPVNALKYE